MIQTVSDSETDRAEHDNRQHRAIDTGVTRNLGQWGTARADDDIEAGGLILIQTGRLHFQ